MAILLNKLRTGLIFDRGVRLAEKGDYQRALSYFEEVMERAPDFALAYANTGFCHYKLGAAGDAQRAYEQAQELAPEDAENYYDLGCIHHGQGQRKAAMECFQEALRLQPNHAEAYSALEQVRIELGLPVIEEVPLPDSESEPVKTGEPDAATQAVVLLREGESRYESGDMEGALKAWTDAAELDPKNPQAQNNRAAALFELGRHQEAIDACNRALQAQSNYAIAHMTRAEIYAAMGNRDAVMREYTTLNGIDEEMAQRVLEMIENEPEETP
jgi:tetratricopeptide (TPR) repeat protein